MPLHYSLASLRQSTIPIGADVRREASRQAATVRRVERTWARMGLSGCPIIGRQSVLKLLIDSGGTQSTKKAQKVVYYACVNEARSAKPAKTCGFSCGNRQLL